LYNYSAGILATVDLVAVSCIFFVVVVDPEWFCSAIDLLVLPLVSFVELLHGHSIVLIL
jgi:hypothetical protein